MDLVLKTSDWYRSILSVRFTRSVAFKLPENAIMGQQHLSKACWELYLSDDQPHSDYNGQWQRALWVVTVLQSSQPNLQRNEKRKICTINQIKINAEYRGMLPRPRLDLSCAPCLRPIGLSPGSWQTSPGLGSMSRYSAQILNCIIQKYRNINQLAEETAYMSSFLGDLLNVVYFYIKQTQYGDKYLFPCT